MGVPQNAGDTPDPEAMLDDLVDSGVVDEAPDGALTLTPDFESTRGVYWDTYGYCPEDQLLESVCDLFDLDREAATELFESGEITREEVTAYLSLRSFLDDPRSHPELAVMSSLVTQLDVGSPVPRRLDELDDDGYEAFLADHPDCVVFVWKHECDPCEEMKDDLDAILDGLPEGVATAGVDGEACGSFRLDFAVDTAPSVLVFVGGELAEHFAGRQDPDALVEYFDETY